MAAKKKKEAAATPAKASASGTDASKQANAKEKSAEKSELKSSPTKPGLLGRLNDWVDTLLFSEVSIAPLVLFRIVFGLIMLWQVTRYMNRDSISYYYMEPEWYPKVSHVHQGTTLRQFHKATIFSPIYLLSFSCWLLAVLWMGVDAGTPPRVLDVHLLLCYGRHLLLLHHWAVVQCHVRPCFPWLCLLVQSRHQPALESLLFGGADQLCQHIPAVESQRILRRHLQA